MSGICALSRLPSPVPRPERLPSPVCPNYVSGPYNRSTTPSSRFGNQRGAVTTTGRIADHDPPL